MLNAKNISITALLLAAGLPAAAQAQAPKISGLVQAWYSQMMDSNLRNNTSTGYFPLPSQFTENGLSFKRIDVRVSGGFGNLEYEIMVDPTLDNNILQDAFIKYKLPYNVEIKLGQFKPLQTLETLTSSAEILFAERAMLVREFGDPTRDRGVTLSVGFGDPAAFGGRFHAGVFNGAGRTSDSNAQSDFAARLEMNYGKYQVFGLYTLQGSTNLADNDKGAFVPLDFRGYDYTYDNDIDEARVANFRNSVLDNNDKINNYGAYYRFQNEKFHASAELITGLVGRRKASLGAADGSARREHLDQKFLGYVGTFGYTAGKHTFAVRYDHLDYNSGSDWYGAANPYLRDDGDFAPSFDEITLGYTFRPMPEKYKSAAIKVNYIMRSKNFLYPNPSKGQVGEQGGDTFVVCFQMGF